MKLSATGTDRSNEARYIEHLLKTVFDDPLFRKRFIEILQLSPVERRMILNNWIELFWLKETGPEIIQITDPQSVGYDIGIHYVNDFNYGASQATVTVSFDGSPVYQYPGKTLSDGQFWHLGSVDWPTGTVTLDDTVTAGVP